MSSAHNIARDLANQIFESSDESEYSNEDSEPCDVISLEEMDNLDLLKNIVLNSSGPIFSSQKGPNFRPGSVTPRRDSASELEEDSDIPFNSFSIPDSVFHH